MLLTLIFSCLSFLFSQTHTPITYSVSDHIKGYWEYLPADYNTSSKNYPLIIFFHGIGEVGTGSKTDLQKVLKNGIPKLINEGTFPKSVNSNGKDFSFIVVSPQLTNTSRSVKEINALIDYCAKKYRVDKTRIYMTGLSQGGGTSWFYCSQTAESGKRLAAMLVIAGNLPPNDNYVANVAKSNLPVWVTHNRGDNVVNVSTSIGWENKLTAYSPVVKPASLLNVFEASGHNAWDQTYNPSWKPRGLNVYEWMLQYTRVSGVVVPVTVVNKAPVATVNPVTNITLPANTVTLNGSGSKDSDGSIKSYTWKYVSGPSGSTLENGTTSIATVKNLSQGAYSFQLSVADDKGATATSNVSFTVFAAANVVPTASISGATTITLPTNSVTLDGSASKDADGSIKTYNWKKVSGGNCTIASASGSKTAISGLTAGTYTFSLTVTDDKGATATTNSNVTVKAAATNVAQAPAPTTNKVPVASVKEIYNITLPVNTVNLDGSSSYDTDGSIVAYEWKFLSGDGGYSYAGPRTSNLKVYNLRAGTRTFRLTVKDNKGATSYKDITFKVYAANSVNTLPVASIKSISNITLPVNTVTLDGASSSDKDGGIRNYAWKYVSGPSGYSLDNASAATTGLKNLSAGTYSFQLTVTDDRAGTATNKVSFTVAPQVAKPTGSVVNLAVQASAANKIPAAIIKKVSDMTLPTDSIFLDGGSSMDTDGVVKSYNWKFLSGDGGYSYAGPRTSLLKVYNLRAGKRTFRLTVTDDKGATDYADVTFSVYAASTANTAPTAVITGTNNITLPTSATTLSGGSSTDKDGSIASYEWKYVSGPSTYKLTPSGSQVAVSGLTTAGSYVFNLTVTDNRGAKSSVNSTVVVNNAPVAANAAPVAAISGTTSITLPTSSTTLSGSGSTDSDGSIASYTWKYVSGPSTYTLSPSGSQVAVSGLSTSGSYVFSLTVTDNKGATNTKNTTVVVSPASNSSSNTTTNCGCNVTLTPNSGGAIVADGNNLGVKPGNVVCIKAGKYNKVTLSNFNGTAASPITFKNCGGQVVIFTGTSAGNINITYSSFFKFTGTGSSDKYGFKIWGATPGVYSGTGVTVSTKSTDFEIDHIEINKVGIGLMVKTDPKCDPDTWGENFTMRNVSLHDLYVHDATHEGFYCGYSMTSATMVCSNVSKTLFPQAIRGLKIYNNIVDSTQWDGIQISTAPEGVQVYNNKVTNYGTVIESGQMSGIQFGAGTNGSVYNNTVMNGSGAGISIMGEGNTQIYNNLVVNVGNDKNASSVGQNGIFIDYRPRTGAAQLNVFVANNTIINPKRHGIYFLNSYGNTGTNNHFYNNLFVLPVYNNDHKSIASAVANTQSNNLSYTTVAAAKFADAGNNNYQLTSTSPAKDAGKDLASFNITGVKSDIVNTARPQYSAYDIGAYELKSGTSARTVASTEAAAQQTVLQDRTMTVDLTTEDLQLDANKSIVTKGEIAGYEWKYVSGPKQFTLVNSDKSSAQLKDMDGGIYTFELTVKDANNLLSVSKVNIIANKNSALGLKLSPVPTKDILTINLNDASRGKALIQIVDMYGKVVATRNDLSKDFNLLQTTMNVSSLPNGNYFIVSVIGNKKISGRFMKAN